MKANSSSHKPNGSGTVRGSTTETFTEAAFGPLSNVHFAVFALGSSAYPNFCSFGKYVDSVLGELGGERLLKVAYGDEMCGQEQSFRKWAPEMFRLACETFCLDGVDQMTSASLSMRSVALSVDTVRLVDGTTAAEAQPIEQQLNQYYSRRTVTGHVKRRPTNLQQQVSASERSTILVEIEADDVSSSASRVKTPTFTPDKYLCFCFML